MAGGETLQLLLQGIAHVSPQSVIMLAIASVLLYLGIARNYEPLLLVPIGAGCLLANLPLSPLIAEEGMLRLLYHAGVANEVFRTHLRRHRCTHRLRAIA
jgi:oxaloacetate decarboxylase beta subunit